MREHEEKIIKKLNSIIITKIHSVLPEVELNHTPSKGTEAIVSNTKILHDILLDYFQKETLKLILEK